MKYLSIGTFTKFLFRLASSNIYFLVGNVVFNLRSHFNLIFADRYLIKFSTVVMDVEEWAQLKHLQYLQDNLLPLHSQTSWRGHEDILLEGMIFSLTNVYVVIFSLFPTTTQRGVTVPGYVTRAFVISCKPTLLYLNLTPTSCVCSGANMSRLDHTYGHVNIEQGAGISPLTTRLQSRIFCK